MNGGDIMNMLDSMNAVIAYIEEHLLEDLNMPKLSKIAKH